MRYIIESSLSLWSLSLSTNSGEYEYNTIDTSLGNRDSLYNPVVQNNGDAWQPSIGYARQNP